MNDQFYIYSKRIEDFDKILQEISAHYSEEFYRNKDQMTLFEIEERDKIHYFNREIELKSQRFSELIDLRNKLIGMHQEFQLMQVKLKANQTILKTIPRVDMKHEAENPYVHILKEEIRDIEISLEKFKKPIIVIYIPREEFYLIHLNSPSDRQRVIDFLMERILDWSHEDIIEDFQTYFNQSSLEELRFHNIEIEKAVKEHNEKKRIQQYWEITYEVKYTIPNLLNIMQSEEWEDKINDYSNCKVHGDSIIFEYTSEEELTGIDVHPDDKNLNTKLYNECLSLYEAYLSEPYELDLLERIIDNTEQYELKVTDFCYGNE